MLTGDLDQLISPKNSLKMASLIPGARLTILPGGGHRVLWEATDECVSHIAGFLDDVENGRDVSNPVPLNGHAPPLLDTLASTTQWFFGLPSTLTSAAFDSLTIARQSMLVGDASRYGDGKPIVLVPPHLGSDLALMPLSTWLKALGYRPATAGLFLNLGDAPTDRALAKSIHDITARVGRKAVLVAHSTGHAAALRAAEAHERSRLGRDRVRRISACETIERRAHALCHVRLADAARDAGIAAAVADHRHRAARGCVSNFFSPRIRRPWPGSWRAPECDAAGPGNRGRHASLLSRTPGSWRSRDWGWLR